MMRSPTHFLRHENGIAMMEFAILLPLLLVLLVGSVEVIRLLYVNQKVEKAGYVIADVVTRYTPAANPAAAGQISETEMNTNVFPLFGRIMGDQSIGGFKDATKQAVIVTSITKTAGVKKINWQISSPNASSTDNTLTTCDSFSNCPTSIVNGKNPGPTTRAVTGTSTSFPASIEGSLATMPNGDTMVVTEVFFMYTPAFQTVLQSLSSLSHVSFYLQPHLYAKRTYFVPRNGALTYLPPTYPAP